MSKTNELIHLLYEKSDFTTKEDFCRVAGLKKRSGQRFMSKTQKPVTNHSRLLDLLLDKYEVEDIINALDFLDKKRIEETEKEQFL